MDRLMLLPVFIIFTQVLLTFQSEAQSSSRSGRRQGFLNGRRGEMDGDLDLSVVVERRPPTDNRRPGHRDVALASLEILVAGQRTKKPTTPAPKQVTRRPLPVCRNGGIRLLGSFCYCTSKFMGRYCEIYRYNSSCGRVPHGRWVYLNCNSCHCVAGVLKCQPHVMPGCDIQSEVSTTVSLPNDDDDELVAFEYNSATRRSYHNWIVVSSLMMAVLMCRILISIPDR
ncbi:uncharacterized protein LOC129270774 [Lytechinus pictus]|uniref:uncharacterized protein LOC129270774 n=1 Tax=Lytechinus pictus TaxID=7653 RepID=UPI00240E7324|nr:uncharacterized protein LOC129270778 [Lytechinus pictus]